MTVDGDDDEDGSGKGSKGEMTMDDEDSGKVSNGEGGMISGSLSYLEYQTPRATMTVDDDDGNGKGSKGGIEMVICNGKGGMISGSKGDDDDLDRSSLYHTVESCTSKHNSHFSNNKQHTHFPVHGTIAPIIIVKSIVHFNQSTTSNKLKRRS